MSDVTLLVDREIDPGFLLRGYRLVPGYRGEVALPLEPFLRLYAVKHEQQILIAKPSDLSALVTGIRSEDEAWRFLRLFTAPATHYLFQRDIYTIDLEVSARSEAARFGVIRPDVAQRVGYRPTEMRIDNQQYIAQRDLASGHSQSPSGPLTLVRRFETLSRAGAYRFLEDQRIGQLGREEVPFPAYE